MPIVDEQGRLFGRWNLLDAMVGIALLGLLPLSYGAYALFRTPPPRLISVDPGMVTVGPNLRVKIRGENLRPYLRVSFGTAQGLTFLFNSTTEAEVELGDLQPGVYDAVLYDFTQERSRLPKALTVMPSPMPTTEVIAVGTFGNLLPADAAKITPGMAVPGVGTVLHVGRPLPDLARVFAGYATVEIPAEKTVRVPVSLRVACYVRSSQGVPQCVGEGIALQPTVLLFLATPLGKLPFQVDQVRGLEPVEALRVSVRLSGLPEVLAQIKPGDVDLGVAMNELTAGARVLDTGPVSAGGTRDVVLAVEGQRTSAGWVYAAAPLRAGGPFLLRTPVYEVQGLVRSVVTSEERQR